MAQHALVGQHGRIAARPARGPLFLKHKAVLPSLPFKITRDYSESENR